MQDTGVVDRLVVAVTYAYDKAAEASTARGLTSIVAAVGVASAAWAGLAVNAARSADEAYDAAKRIGMTVSEYTALGYAAERSGTSMDVLGRGLITVQRAMTQAKSGKGPVAEAFRDIGLGAEATAGKLGLAADALPRILDGLRAIEDPGKRASTALLLLGEAGPSLTELIENGSEGLAELTVRAKLAGAVIEDDMVGPSQVLVDSLDDLGTMAEGAARRVGFALVPALGRATTAVADWIAEQSAAGGQIDRLFLGVEAFGKFLDNVLDSALGRATLAVVAFGAAWGTLGAAKAMYTAASAASPLVAGLGSVAGAAGGAAAAAGPFVLAALGVVAVLDDLSVAADGGDAAIARLAKSMGVESEVRSGLKAVKDLLGEAKDFAGIAATAIGQDMVVAFDNLATAIRNASEAWDLSFLGTIADAVDKAGEMVMDTGGVITRQVNRSAGGFNKAFRYAEGDLSVERLLSEPVPAGSTSKAPLLVQAIAGIPDALARLAERQRERALNYGPQQVTTGPITIQAGMSREEVARVAGQEVERQVLAAQDVSGL